LKREKTTMTGYILLEGGAEFGGLMTEPDHRAIALAGGPNVPISIIPTAAAPDKNHRRAGNNAISWFRHLGATRAESLPLIDRASANDPALATRISQSRLIYLLGGFTGYLGETLADSACWQAMLSAYAAGAVIAGSSAGAMVLCEYYYDPAQQQVVEGLNLLSNTCVLPHHNTFGKGWASQLARQLPHTVLLGIDERTGMLDDGAAGRKVGWHVYGQGSVTLYRNGRPTVHESGEAFTDKLV
jgi:cyanophycinase